MDHLAEIRKYGTKTYALMAQFVWRKIGNCSEKCNRDSNIMSYDERADYLLKNHAPTDGTNRNKNRNKNGYKTPMSPILSH
jgi:hypothetical protein